MKNFILTIMFALMSIFTVNATPVTFAKNFKQVVVEAPCRIVYGISDTTMVRVNNTNADYEIHYEVKDDVLYIKPNRYLDYNNIEKVPVIRIINKNVMPQIITRSSLQICENTTSTKKQKTENGTTEIAKN